VYSVKQIPTMKSLFHSLKRSLLFFFIVLYIGIKSVISILKSQHMTLRVAQTIIKVTITKWLPNIVQHQTPRKIRGNWQKGIYRKMVINQLTTKQINNNPSKEYIPQSPSRVSTNNFSNKFHTKHNYDRSPIMVMHLIEHDTVELEITYIQNNTNTYRSDAAATGLNPRNTLSFSGPSSILTLSTRSLLVSRLFDLPYSNNVF